MKRRSFLSLLSATTAGAVITPALPHSALPHSALPPGNKALAGKFSFIAIGDMGTGESNQYSLAKGIAAFQKQYPFDTALTLGDNIYPDGDPALFKDKFERPYTDLLQRGVCFFAALGNHDVRKGREAEMKYPNFNMNGRPYYSFVKGDGLVEFFALDTTDINRKQLNWLEDALIASKAIWKIAYFHHPIYSSAITHGSDTKLRTILEPIFVKHGVTAALSGHDHTYERTAPQRGVQYFVSGAGGQLRKGDLDKRTPFFSTGNDAVNSYIYFEAAPDKLSFQAIDAAGNTIDSGALTRVRAATFGQ
jgi:Calcineurin-like phosphoesterase